jgi:hypothetical protein
MTYDRKSPGKREQQNNSLLFSKSFRSVKCLTVAMHWTCSAGKSGSNRGVLSGADVSLGRRRLRMSRGSRAKHFTVHLTRGS